MSASPSRSNYHHGDLRNALLATAADLARTDGPQAVTLREAARRNGVSPSAAYRHFADQQALVTAVAIGVLLDVAGRMRADIAAVAPAVSAKPGRTDAATDAAVDALTRFRAVGLAYVTFARAEPGLFRTAYAPGVVLPGAHDPSLDDHPQRVLGEALDDLVDLGLLGVEQRRHGEVAAWAGVHGIAILLLDGVLGAADGAPEPLVEAVLDMIGTGLCGPALFHPPALDADVIG